MSTRFSARFLAGALFAVGLASSACGPRYSAEGGTPAPAAKVEHARPEGELATITLSEEAEARLGITATELERRSVGRTLARGGEIVVPPGQRITVAAPVAGRLALARGFTASPGARVKRDQPLFLLYAYPDVARAREEVQQAEIRVAAARDRAKRSELLLRDLAGSVRGHEEAKTELAAAENALAQARGRLALIEQGKLEGPASPAPVVLDSPIDGMLSAVHVSPDQVVAAGTPLYGVEDARAVWIRVPVYVGEIDTIDVRAPVTVQSLSDRPGVRTLTANPVAAPPTADPAAASADLVYVLANAEGLVRPGERVRVLLPLREQEQALVVPWAAILYDINGGEWVYEVIAPHTFARRRVEVREVSGDLAVLARGPAPGAAIVTAGAAELFGTEFATGK